MTRSLIKLHLRVAEKLTSNDVNVHLVKNANHRFSSENNLEFLSKVLDELLDIKNEHCTGI